MMNNSNINWVGNKVFESGLSRPKSRSSYTAAPAAPVAPVAPVAQTAPVAPAAPAGPAPTQPQTAAPPQTAQQPPAPAPMPSEMPKTDAEWLDSAINQEGPPPSTEKGYIPYYLASNLGKSVRAEFIIGSSQFVDKTGILIEVGINYFVLADVNSRTNIMCDLYSVKFVTILQG